MQVSSVVDVPRARPGAGNCTAPVHIPGLPPGGRRQRGRGWTSLVHVAAWKHHIGLYPLPPLDGALEREVAPWRGTKDTLGLPHTQPLPADLVERLLGLLLAQPRAGS
jgi:hypothetical protein